MVRQCCKFNYDKFNPVNLGNYQLRKSKTKKIILNITQDLGVSFAITITIQIPLTDV